MGGVKRGLAVNISLLVLGCCLALIIMEIILRIYHPFPFRVKANKIVLPANQAYHFVNNQIDKLDRMITHRKNALGFRGEPVPDNFDKYLSIITVGGSTTECFYLNDGKTWPDILNNLLKHRFSPLWLNNAGLDGHSTFGHLVLLQDYLINIKPKVVLFLVGANDVGREDMSDFDKARIPSAGAIATGMPAHRSWWRSMKDHSEVYAIINNLRRYALARKMGLNHREVKLKEVERIDQVDEQMEENIKNLHKQRYLTPLATRLMTLVRLARENGIEPVLITQPALYGNEIDEITKVDLAKIKVIDNINGKLQWDILEYYNDVTRRVGSMEHVPVIDLAKKMPKNSKYYYDFYHFTNEGAEKAAEIIDHDLSPWLAAKFPQFVK